MQKYLRSALAVMAIVVAVILVIFKMSGGMTHIIQTGSMVPTLPVNTFILDLPAKDIKAGDIVTFQQPGMSKPVTHRIVSLHKDGTMITKGDANPSADNPDVPFTKSDVTGEYLMQIPVTAPAFWLSGPGIATGAFILLYLLFAFWPNRTSKQDEEGDEQLDESREATLESHPV